LSYYDNDLVDIDDFVFQSYEIAVISLSVIGEIIYGDHMMCSEFIGVVRDHY